MRTKVRDGLGRGRVSYVDPVWVALGRLRGIAPATARHEAHSARERYRSVIQAHLDSGATERLFKYHDPIEQLLGGVPVQPLDELLMSAIEADSAEDVARSAYLCSMSIEDLKAWDRKLVRQRAQSAAVSQAIRNELYRRDR